MLKKISETEYQISGEFRYAIITKPKLEQKFQSEEKELKYRVDLVLNDDTTFGALSGLLARKLVKQAIKPMKDSGELTFQFRRLADVDVKTQTVVNAPVVVDAQGVPLDPEIMVGNGSEGIIAFSLVPTGANKHRVVLDGVQVTKLVEYKSEMKPDAKPRQDLFSAISPEDMPF